MTEHVVIDVRMSKVEVACRDTRGNFDLQNNKSVNGYGFRTSSPWLRSPLL